MITRTDRADGFALVYLDGPSAHKSEAKRKTLRAEGWRLTRMMACGDVPVDINKPNIEVWRPAPPEAEAVTTS